MIYFNLFIASVSLLFLEQSKGINNYKPILKIGFVLFLILFIGLRYCTGPDYESYQTIFHDVERQKGLEPVFRFLFFSFNFLRLDYILFLLFIAVLSIAIKVYSFNRYSPYFFMSVLIALPVTFLGDMGQIRFSLAIAVLWLSIPYCINRDLPRFLLVIALAGMMHYSSFIFLPVYWLCMRKINLFFILLIWSICYLFSFTLIGENLPSYIADLDIREFTEKVDMYSVNEVNGGRYVFSLLGFLSKLGILSLVYYSPFEDTKLKQLYVNIYFFGGCLFYLFSSSELFGARLSTYCFSFEALMVPLAIYYIKDVRLHYLVIAFFVAKSFILFYDSIIVHYSDMYLPYRNVLQLLY